LLADLLGILFIRTGQTSDIISKAVAEIKNHPSLKSAASGSPAADRHDFVLYPASDPAQEIRLALLPFALQ
jgi:hypothetical protein